MQIDTSLDVAVKNESVTPNFMLRSRTLSNLTIAFSNDITIAVQLYAGYLNFHVQLPSTYMGTTMGLLGNGNGNVSDEFIFRNGTVLDNFASDREIHQFCQSCKPI